MDRDTTQHVVRRHSKTMRLKKFNPKVVDWCSATTFDVKMPTELWQKLNSLLLSTVSHCIIVTSIIRLPYLAYFVRVRSTSYRVLNRGAKVASGGFVESKPHL